MSQTALAIRHVAFEDLGILGPLLTERGYSIRYLDAGIDLVDATALSSPDLVIVLGGPIGVYETVRYPFLIHERVAIAARLALGKPTLGICLGAQLYLAGARRGSSIHRACRDWLWLAGAHRTRP